MTDKAFDLEHSIADLHVSAGRISGGLQKVLGVLEEIAVDNADVLSLSEEDARRDDASAAVIDSFVLIRDQIREITDFSKQFDEKITNYGDEMVELKVELEKNKKDALVDSLTGISNRRRFEQVLGELLEDMKGVEGHLAVMIADIDNFKKVNDRHGHAIGDQVLKLVAHAFAGNLKKGDFEARWGGDEFAAILLKINPTNAVAVARRVRDTIASKTIRNKDSGETLGRVSLSFGITGLKPDDTVESLVKRADKAMYRAKNSGKNQVATE